MSVMRSVMIAAGAGVAGLALGLVLGQGQLFARGSSASAAEPAAETPDGAYMIVMGTVHDRPAFFFSGYMPGLPDLYAPMAGATWR